MKRTGPRTQHVWFARGARAGSLLAMATALLLLPSLLLAEPPRALEQIDAPPAEGLLTGQADVPTLQADTGRLVGFVREGTQGPGIARTVVSLEGPEERSAVANEEGYFRFELLPPGSYTLRAEHLAYATLEVEVEVAGDNQTTRIEVRLLPEAIALDPIVVEVEGARPTFGPLVEVYERVDRQRALGLGRILTRDEIEARIAGRLSELLHPMPGVSIVQDEENDLRAWMSGGAQRLREPCFASLYLDGVRVLRPRGGQGSIDEFVLVREIEVLEVYRGAAQVPPEYGGSDAQCGVVAVWTRRGS